MTALEDRPVLTEVEFEQALDELVIVWRRDSSPFITPTDTAARSVVAAYVEALLDANPALVRYLHGQFVVVGPDMAVIPVAGLRDVLTMTQEHGAKP